MRRNLCFPKREKSCIPTQAGLRGKKTLKRKLVLIFNLLFCRLVQHFFFNKEMKRKKNKLIFLKREDFNFPYKRYKNKQRMKSSPHTHIKPIFFLLREINLLFLFLSWKSVVPNNRKVGYIFTKKKKM
jgi:hypothetical protein